MAPPGELQHYFHRKIHTALWSSKRALTFIRFQIQKGYLQGGLWCQSATQNADTYPLFVLFDKCGDENEKVSNFCFEIVHIF